MCNLDVILKIPLPPLLIITTKKKDLEDRISKKHFFSVSCVLKN
mgnify:CR=1 FL=1